VSSHKDEQIRRAVEAFNAIESPDAAAAALLEVSDRMFGDAERVSHDWQDAGAGAPWKSLARAISSKAVCKVAALEILQDVRDRRRRTPQDEVNS
jgi:hypothetical protein